MWAFSSFYYEISKKSDSLKCQHTSPQLVNVWQVDNHNICGVILIFNINSSMTHQIRQTKRCHLEAVRTFLSVLMACFLALLSSVLSSCERGCVETRGRSESLILSILSTCLPVRPRFGRTSRGIPVLLDTWICLGCKHMFTWCIWQMRSPKETCFAFKI